MPRWAGSALDISMLSDEFLAEVRDIPSATWRWSCYRSGSNDEIRARSRKTQVESCSFREWLEQALISYQNCSTRTAQIIAHLIAPLERGAGGPAGRGPRAE